VDLWHWLRLDNFTKYGSQFLIFSQKTKENSVKKNVIITVALLLLSVHGLNGKDNHIVLTSPIIDLIDGKSFAIDGEVFGLIIQVRREVRKRLYGIRSKNGKFTGIYEFNGEMLSVAELTLLETQIDSHYNTQRNTLAQSRETTSEQEWNYQVEKLEQEYAQRKSELFELLNFVKEDFLSVTTQYCDGIRGFKGQILMLIEDSCHQRGKESCFLLKWGDERDGNEGELMRKEILSFKEFETFCIDLSNYLEDMARSCPKGKKQFLDMIKKKQ